MEKHSLTMKYYLVIQHCHPCKLPHRTCYHLVYLNLYACCEYTTQMDHVYFIAAFLVVRAVAVHSKTNKYFVPVGSERLSLFNNISLPSMICSK